MPGGVWDPGSTALPSGVAVVMIGCSLYLLLKDVRESVRSRGHDESLGKNGDGFITEKSHDPEAGGVRAERRMLSATVRLIAVTVLVLLAYVLSFRAIGFVISTTVMLFTLTYFYELGDVRVNVARHFVRYGIIATVITVVLFHIGVTALQWTRYFGRLWEIELLRSRAFTALLGLLLWSVLLWPVFVVMKRRFSFGKGPRIPLPGGAQQAAAVTRASILAVSTTLLLYLVFQQLFRVALPTGLFG